MRGKCRDHLRISCKVWTKEVKKMSTIKKLLAVLTIFGAFGIVYALYALKTIPDTFEFDIDEMERRDYDREI